MRTITEKPVYFGELAGTLLHESVFFDWQLLSTQKLASSYGYSFAEILAKDGIPYAPVSVGSTVHRYPAIGDVVTVTVVPVDIGESSLDLRYVCTDGAGDPIAVIDATHVTIGSDGSALAFPEETRRAYSEARTIPDLEPDPPSIADEREPIRYFGTTVPIRRPHIEGAELAYFEEYPRFAAIALEEFLASHETRVSELRGEKQPYKLRDWYWEFKSPVRFESELRVDCHVIGVNQDRIRIAHEFSSGGTINIEGVSEYGCFSRTGEPVPFNERMLKPFEKDG